jgi:hypothetical protein
MRQRQHHAARHGATMTELAIIASAAAMLLLGSIDLGTAVFRNHVLSNAAREGARKAMVHGQFAQSGWNQGPWGPGSTYPTSVPYTVNAGNNSDTIASTIQPFLAGMNPNNVTITVAWPDGNNNVESRVQVTLSTTWQPLLLFIFGNRTVNLSASSTMPIAH